LSACGWLTAIKDGGTNTIVSYEYDAAGRRTKRTLENSTFTVYDYDSANQLTNLWHQRTTGGTNTISQFQYGYDGAGNRTWVKRSHQSDKGDVYAYDAADQLTGVKYNASSPDSSPSGWDREVLYFFDAAGNRTTVVERASATNVLTYTVNDLNQYTKVEVDAADARAWYRLDDGTGSTAADSSGNGHTGTLAGGPSWISAVSSNGLSFDGVNDEVSASTSTSLDFRGL